MKVIFLLMSALTAFALDFPMSLAVVPDGRVLVLNAGAKASISIVNGPDLPLPDAFLGLTFAPDGKTVYAGGGSRGVVYELTYTAGELKLAREIKASDFVGDVALSPDGRLIYAADLYANLIVVINPQSGRVIDRFKTGRRPYRILFHPDGRSYFVSSWADAAVYQYNTTNGEEIGRIRLGPHATDMVLSAYQPELEEGQPAASWKYRLFVAASNTNSVYVVGIGENKTMNLVDTILVAPASPASVSPLGMTPSALALSADQKHLYVACSDADAVASVDVSAPRGVLEGFIKAGAYPAALRASGDRIWVANAHGNSVEPLDPATPAQLTLGEPFPPGPAEHVIYVIRDTQPEALMHAIAGTAPDYTVKMGRRPNFDPSDPANTPLAGYLWTNAVSAGIAVRNYGVFMRNGQAMDPGARAFSKPDAAAFLEDLKQFDSTGAMPRLIVIQAASDQTIDTIKAAIAKSRFAKTEIVVGDLRRAEALLGLRPMTRQEIDLKGLTAKPR
jgi:YVTN family beta-propeller protein